MKKDIKKKYKKMLINSLENDLLVINFHKATDDIYAGYFHTGYYSQLCESKDYKIMFNFDCDSLVTFFVNIHIYAKYNHRYSCSFSLWIPPFSKLSRTIKNMKQKIKNKCKSLSIIEMAIDPWIR